MPQVDFLMEYVLHAVRDLSQQRFLFSQLIEDVKSVRWTPASDNEIYWSLFDVILEHERRESAFGKLMSMVPDEIGEEDLVDMGLVPLDNGEAGEGRVVRSDSGCCFIDNDKGQEENQS